MKEAKHKYGLPLIKSGQWTETYNGKVVVLNGTDEKFLNNPNITEEQKEKFIMQRYLNAKKAGFKGNIIALKKSLQSPSKEDQKSYLKALNVGYRKPFETFRKEVLRKTDENES